jgi:hypothetical protein
MSRGIRNSPYRQRGNAASKTKAALETLAASAAERPSWLKLALKAASTATLFTPPLAHYPTSHMARRGN